jgi:sphingomyelin phosphodiesterase 2
MLPQSHHHRLLTAHSPLRDVWLELFPDSSLGPVNHPPQAARNRPVPTAQHNLLVNGATSDGEYNTWRWPKDRRAKLARGDACLVDADTPCPHGKRLDYIFASTGCSDDDPSSSSPAKSSRSGWVVEAATVGMTERHPELLCSLSDHFAVCATLRRHTIDEKKPNEAYDAQLQPRSTPRTLPPEVYAEILHRTRAFAVGEKKQQWWRGMHFYASVIVWVACLVAVWFSPRNYVAFILLLVGSLFLASGVVDGLIALLFFSSELRALKEFEWDMVQAHAAADAAITDQKDSNEMQ